MAKITGLGGVFYKSPGTERTAAWYRDTPGLGGNPARPDCRKASFMLCSGGSFSRKSAPRPGGASCRAPAAGVGP
jgi:hypothetical protein